MYQYFRLKAIAPYASTNQMICYLQFPSGFYTIPRGSALFHGISLYSSWFSVTSRGTTLIIVIPRCSMLFYGILLFD